MNSYSRLPVVERMLKSNPTTDWHHEGNNKHSRLCQRVHANERSTRVAQSSWRHCDRGLSIVSTVSVADPVELIGTNTQIAEFCITRYCSVGPQKNDDVFWVLLNTTTVLSAGFQFELWRPTTTNDATAATEAVYTVDEAADVCKMTLLNSQYDFMHEWMANERTAVTVMMQLITYFS